MDITYWNREMETIDRDALNALQLERLRKTVDTALRTPFYEERLGQEGITSGTDIKMLADVRKLPFTHKKDLRKTYPDKLISVPMEEVVRIHTSSGTTGTPTVIYHTREDLDNWTELTCRGVTATGAGRRDVFQNMMSYGLFTGGLGLHYAAERIGMLTIPASSGQTKRQIRLMRDFHTTIVHITPSYLLHIFSMLEKNHVQPRELSLSKAYLGAEAYSARTRDRIEELLGIDVYNSYGLTEMNGPGVAFECVYKDDMHIWEDAYLVEMINPETEEPVPEGEEGELVLTTLQREAAPLIRYRVGDLTVLRGDPCPCGRTHRRIARIKGRADDMLIVNGVNVYPSQIESLIMSIPEVGTNYQIWVEKIGSLDKMTIKTEVNLKMLSGNVKELDTVRVRISERVKGNTMIRPHVELHEPGGLPVTEGKARRVFDQRPGL